MPSKDAQIASLAIGKIAGIYLASTSPDGSSLDPGAYRATCSTIRNVLAALAEELDQSQPAPAAFQAAAAAIAPAAAPAAAPAPVLAEGRYQNHQLVIGEIQEQKMARSGEPTIRFKDAGGQVWSTFGSGNIAAVLAAGPGGTVTGNASVKRNAQTGGMWHTLFDAAPAVGGAV